MTLYLMDLDGTLIEGYMDNHKKPEPGNGPWVTGDHYDEVVLLPNVRERIRHLAMHDKGARFAIVTNQAGVAFGFVTEEQAYAKIGKVIAALDCFWSMPFSVHVCFNHPDAPDGVIEGGHGHNPYRYDDPRRKPGPEMIREAMRYHGVVYDACCVAVMMTGDMDADSGAAAAAGIPYVDHETFFKAPSESLASAVATMLTDNDRDLIDSIANDIERGER